MSTGLHAAREDLHLPHVPSANGYLHGDANGLLPKPLSLSPRTFGMEDLRDFCGPLGSFKTGLTPRVFSTGLTPRSGFTPRFTTGFTPRIGGTGGAQDTNSFFSRNTGFSPPRQSDVGNKISPTGFTPKDISGMKVPMRFPGTYNATPQKMEPHPHGYPQEQPPQMMHKAPPPPQMQPPPHMQHLQPHQVPHHQQAEMNHINMSMYDYMNRPTIPQQQQQQHQAMMAAAVKPQKSSSPVSDDLEGEDLDERRRMKNRERVRKCRKRKQDRLNFLEDRTAELEKENGQLKAKLARKTVGAKAEPLTETQLKELRKKQNTTLAAYVRAYNESAVDGSFEAGAKAVWADNAEIVYGNNGTSIAGIATIVANKTASAAVFQQYKIKNYNVQWKDTFPEKCLVHWEIETVVKADAAVDVPLTAPFPDLAKHYANEETITVHMISHLTFDDGKIVEEVRQMNLSAMAEAVFAKFASEAGKASEVLRCLMKA